jgi:hypothetical protein
MRRWRRGIEEEVSDDGNEEQGKSAQDAEAAAKTSTGDAVSFNHHRGACTTV